MGSYITGPLFCEHLCNMTFITKTLITRSKNDMNKLNIPNSFEECRIIEEVVAFWIANGHDRDEVYKMVRQILRPYVK